MPLNTTWGTESRTRDPLHLTSAPRPVVLDANRITDSHRDFVCDDPTKTGVFNLDCGAPPPPPPPPPTTGPSSLGASVNAPATGPGSMVASVAPPVAGPGSLDAVEVPPFNISPYIGTAYDTDSEILALQPTAPDGLVAYNQTDQRLWIWVSSQAVWHKFQIPLDMNIAPIEDNQIFVNSGPINNDNIKFAEDVNHLFIHDGTDWHRFKEE